MTQTTYSPPIIRPDQPITVPSHSVIYVVEVEKVTTHQSQLWLTLNEIDGYLSFLHTQLEMYGVLNLSDKQSGTENIIDQWNTFRSQIQENLDILGYIENPPPQK